MYGLTAACGELGISWVNGFDMEVYRRAILDFDPEFICPLALIYVTKGGRGRRDERNQTKETKRSAMPNKTEYVEVQNRYSEGDARRTYPPISPHSFVHLDGGARFRIFLRYRVDVLPARTRMNALRRWMCWMFGVGGLHVAGRE